MIGTSVDGQDVFAVRKEMDTAIERARKEQRPTLVEVRTTRFMGHSMSDAASGTYRSKEELDQSMQRDPIVLLKTKMLSDGMITEDDYKKMDDEAKAAAQAAWDFADAVSGAVSGRAVHSCAERRIDSWCCKRRRARGGRTMTVMTYRDALNQALREELNRDESVFLMGEEVAEYNGAYKVSRGLLDEFGPKRIVDTPITELGFAGVGVGAAMAGLRPIIEFMTWNFALLALDQVVNAAAKMLYMSNGQYKMPMVFRGPNGAALQLAAQHSQAWESWLAHIPGLKVVAPGTPADAKGLLKAAIRDDNPVVVLEGEMLYNTKGEVDENPDIVIPLGKAELKREGEHCSIITSGKMVLVALQAADQLAKQGVNVDVLDLRTIRPMDVEAIATSVDRRRIAR